MDDFDIDNPFAEEDKEETIPFDDEGDNNVLHSPLDLGGGGVKDNVAPLEIEPIEKPTAATSAVPTSVGVVASSGEHITGVRTFFTKLHAGALDFLDEQITGWLQKNPKIVIKRTNTICGPVIGKKAEPSIIITVWY